VARGFFLPKPKVALAPSGAVKGGSHLAALEREGLRLGTPEENGQKTRGSFANCGGEAMELAGEERRARGQENIRALVKPTVKI